MKIETSKFSIDEITIHDSMTGIPCAIDFTLRGRERSDDIFMTLRFESEEDKTAFVAALAKVRWTQLLGKLE